MGCGTSVCVWLSDSNIVNLTTDLKSFNVLHLNSGMHRRCSKLSAAAWEPLVIGAGADNLQPACLYLLCRSAVRIRWYGSDDLLIPTLDLKINADNN